jgi:hypothetical protein
MKYMAKVKYLISKFDFFELTYVPREKNSRADLLSKLASNKKADNNKTVIQETIATPSTELDAHAVAANEMEDWRISLMEFILHDKLPEDKEETARLRRVAAKYTIMSGKLYKMGFSTPMLLCLGAEEARKVLADRHDGECGSHVGA